jgi:hypothetical protein
LAQSVVTGGNCGKPGQTRLRDNARRERQVNHRQNLPQEQDFSRAPGERQVGALVRMSSMREFREHRKFLGVLIAIALVLSVSTTADTAWSTESIYRSLPAAQQPTARDVVKLPDYQDGEAVALQVGGRFAYLIKPRGKLDPLKRWVWIFPFEHGLADAGGGIEHKFYVDALLAKGFHVAGIDIGVACGSPRAAERCQQFYSLLVGDYRLNPRARLLAQSNGGLNAYAWGMRYADCVNRIAGIYPATDLRSWPGVAKAVAYPSKGLGFDLTSQALAPRFSECNPIENLAPLAKAGVKVLHLHGDRDKVVPLEANSAALVRRYRALGGSVDLVVVEGFGHGGRPFSQSKRIASFLLAD